MPPHPENIDQWLEELTGQAPSAAGSGESETLRRVILAEAAAHAAVASDAEADARALQRLMFRLRRERLLAQPRWLPWTVALAAAVSALAIGLAVLRQPEAPQNLAYGEPPIWRGVYAQVDLQADKPREKAEQLLAALRSNGLQADIYTSAYVYTVDAELVRPLPPPVAQIFKELKIEVGAGRVRVNFKP